MSVLCDGQREKWQFVWKTGGSVVSECIQLQSEPRTLQLAFIDVKDVKDDRSSPD